MPHRFIPLSASPTVEVLRKLVTNIEYSHHIIGLLQQEHYLMLLLHLSDIHFRKGEVDSERNPYKYLANEIVLDAAAQCQKIGSPIDLILISGDIAFGGSKDEYDYAYEWIVELCEKCNSDITNVFIVPGNHDIDRTIAKSPSIKAIHQRIKNANNDSELDNLLREHLDDQTSAELLYKPLADYNNFAARFECSVMPLRPYAKRDLKLNDDSILRVVGFNSALISSADDREKDLFIDPACLQLKRTHGVEYLVLCHHSLRWLRQCDELESHLNSVARLHLFGHEHSNRIHRDPAYIRVSASATLPNKSERNWEPGYNFIEVNVENTDGKRKLNVAVHVRVWQSNPNQFRSKMDGDQDVFRSSIALADWSRPPQPRLDTPKQAEDSDVANIDTSKAASMGTGNDITLRFFQLTLSQKYELAGKFDLLKEEDVNLPDFEKFRRVLLRAKEQGIFNRLGEEIKRIAGLE